MIYLFCLPRAYSKQFLIFLIILTFSHGFHDQIAINLLKSGLFLSIPHACPDFLVKYVFFLHFVKKTSFIKLKLFRGLCENMAQVCVFFKIKLIWTSINRMGLSGINNKFDEW